MYLKYKVLPQKLNTVVRQWKEDCTEEGRQVFGGEPCVRAGRPFFWLQLRNAL